MNPLRLSFHFKRCGLWTLSCDFVPHNYETLKWLSSLPILMQESFWWWQCSDRYIISLFPRLHTPPPPPLPHFSPSLISLMVSVNVKHHVYWRCLCVLASHNQLTGFMVYVDVEHPVYLHCFCVSWPLTISEILKRLAPQPILMQTHSGGDTAVRYSSPPPPHPSPHHLLGSPSPSAPLRGQLLRMWLCMK